MAKTASGVDYLKRKNVAKILYDEIKSVEIPLNTKRANLWALGNIGLSELGISYLATDNNIIKTILDMASSSEYLPLRGTCLQVANMISQTNLGRIILKENEWKVNMLSQGNHNSSQFITLPGNISQLFKIDIPHQTNAFQLNDKYWQIYIEVKQKILESLNDIEQEYYNNLVEMPNVANSTKRVKLQKLGE